MHETIGATGLVVLGDLNWGVYGWGNCNRKAWHGGDGILVGWGCYGE